MSKVDEIMIDVFGNIRAVTTGIYYDKLNELISSLEQKGDEVKEHMIFCQPRIEEAIEKIAKYFKIEYRSTTLLPNDTLIVLAHKKVFKNNYDMGWIGGEDE